jgi:hypothetical protein
VLWCNRAVLSWIYLFGCRGGKEQEAALLTEKGQCFTK